MKLKCVINEINCEKNIILDTTKGKFKIPIKKGISTIPILDSSKKHIGLIYLKKDSTVTIKHNNNICQKIIINNDYEFLSSEDSDIFLSDSD